LEGGQKLVVYRRVRRPVPGCGFEAAIDGDETLEVAAVQLALADEGEQGDGASHGLFGLGLG
jgi:hypothetical protein